MHFFIFIFLGDSLSVFEHVYIYTILHGQVSMFVTGNIHFAYVEFDDMMAAGVLHVCYLKNTALDTKYPASYTRLTVTRGILQKQLFVVC